MPGCGTAQPDEAARWPGLFVACSTNVFFQGVGGLVIVCLYRRIEPCQSLLSGVKCLQPHLILKTANMFAQSSIDWNLSSLNSLPHSSAIYITNFFLNNFSLFHPIYFLRIIQCIMGEFWMIILITCKLNESLIVDIHLFQYSIAKHLYLCK